MEEKIKRKGQRRRQPRWSTVDKYNVDQLARDTSFWLARDFANVVPSIKEHPLYARSQFTPEIRDTNVELAYWGPKSKAAEFKRRYQLENFLKKYTFTDDAYSETERAELTASKFVAFQEKLATPRSPYKASTIVVLQEARRIIKGILGDFDMEEIKKHYKFGQKSSIGCPLASAFIDVKLCERQAFSSNWLSVEAFTEYLREDPVLSRHLIDAGLYDGNEIFPTLVESLTYQQVPKTYKINRGITPLTLLALFLSFGVGGVVTEQLRKNAGIDIRRQQAYHRKWIKKYSRTLSHCTTDLKSASDSIVMVLLMWLLPRRWLREVKKFTSRTMDVSGRGLVRVESVLPMGNGATFPLETLIFYALTKAVGNLTRVEGRYSVYGDDLIYPTQIHNYVVGVFTDLGISINTEKTFTDAHFRESCGSDYYYGIDVRPAFFPAAASSLTRTQYASHIYKTINALLNRWDVTEIFQTIKYLLNEIRFTGLEIYRVPRDYPAEAGIQCDDPDVCAMALEIDGYSSVSARVTRYYGCKTTRFRALVPSTGLRKVSILVPYYWQVLKRNASTEVQVPSKFWNYGTAIAQITSRDMVSELRWKTAKSTTWFTKGGKRISKIRKRKKPYVAERDVQLKIGVATVYDWSSRTINPK